MKLKYGPILMDVQTVAAKLEDGTLTLTCEATAANTWSQEDLLAHLEHAGHPLMLLSKGHEVLSVPAGVIAPVATVEPGDVAGTLSVHFEALGKVE